MKLTEHFTSEELACKCGCGLLPPLDDIKALERVRLRCGFPFFITSGARCPDYNDKVSKTGRNGPHTKGAFDIGVIGNRALEVIDAARAEGFTGIGVQQKGKDRFIHIDRLPNDEGQPRPWIWSY